MTTLLLHSNKMKWRRLAIQSNITETTQLKRDNIKYASLLVNLASTLFLQSCERYKEALPEEIIQLLDQKIRPNIESLRKDIDEFNESLRKSEDE